MSLTRERRSGILLHPSSLPGAHGIGDFGAGARRFVDWLAAAGQRAWQVLPLGTPGPGNSPYMSDSAFAGSPLLIDLEELAERGWLDRARLDAAPPFAPGATDYVAARRFKGDCLDAAACRFREAALPADRAGFAAFRRDNAHWCEDHALFSVLGQEHGGTWDRWPAALARREASALAEAGKVHAAAIDAAIFVQWCFHRQWAALRARAAAAGIALIGDMPIYVAHHSADVWANRDLFELDAGGAARVIAGVPPDYFSETGQRWGNPLYRWPAHAASDYRWWASRLGHALALFDAVRIDHFRGFESYWEIPAAAETAVSGCWRPGPGAAIFAALRERLGSLPVIAEDLGIITPAVDALREGLGFPGMRILQFAFDGHSDNPYLPHNHRPDAVVYTGTHDNDTTQGWWHSLDEASRVRVREYLARDGRAIHWDLIRTAFASVADLAIVPMQDVLGLGSEARMNTPGESQGCWTWRLDESRIESWQAPLLADLAQRYGRSGK
jgi:4-alpha-glucanotransferase